MTNQEAISVLESINAKTDYFLINDDARAEAIDMAISALQERDLQPTYNQLATDTISRQAAIDAVKEAIISAEWEYAEEALERLPSAQPEQRWIPVSERLPYIWDERYLVSLAWGGIGVMEYKSTGFHNYGSFTPVPIESITAWMPLPESYRGKEGEPK